MANQSKNAASFGFSPENNGDVNTLALQRAVSGGGTVYIDQIGTYDLSGTIVLDSSTKLVFGLESYSEKFRLKMERLAAIPLSTAVRTPVPTIITLRSSACICSAMAMRRPVWRQRKRSPDCAAIYRFSISGTW